MADEWGEDDATRRAKAALITTTVPNAARVADYLYGGQNNFEADRRAARALAATAPVIADIAPAVRGFQQRVLRFLVAAAGVTQFLDVGTSLPLVGSTHEVAQSLVPESRIAYVDNDPMVLSHARALMKSAPGGAVGYVDADVRDSGAIVAGARETLDLGRPVEVAVIGNPVDPQASGFLEVIRARYLPNRLVAVAPPGHQRRPMPLLSDRSAIGGKVTAYLCEGFVCQAPTTDPSELARQLDAFSARPVAS